jgi:hypothetical protein
VHFDTPSRLHHGRATRGVRDKNGLGQSSRASDRCGRSWCEAIVIDTSPWPDNSRLAVFGQAERETAPSRAQPFVARARLSKGSQAREKRCVTGDHDAVLRSSDERGRARGSYRLQKSTSGAWPLEPVSEELADHSGGSSSSARERGRREEASEAGSLAAKPRDRWRALTQQRRAKAPAGEHS